MKDNQRPSGCEKSGNSLEKQPLIFDYDNVGIALRNRRQKHPRPYTQFRLDDTPRRELLTKSSVQINLPSDFVRLPAHTYQPSPNWVFL
jgi:hypothetical protein